MKIALAVLGLLLVAFLAWGAYLSNTPDGKTKAAERTAIAECRKGEKDELTPIEQRRFIREACDTMEAGYVAKWGNAP